MLKINAGRLELAVVDVLKQEIEVGHEPLGISSRRSRLRREAATNHQGTGAIWDLKQEVEVVEGINHEPLGQPLSLLQWRTCGSSFGKLLFFCLNVA